MNKVFVIGIDSATFDVINPLMARGELPNLLKLVQNGCSGALHSTFPPVTPPAWVSFMTGKNPGKHGVFDFYAPPMYGYDRPVLNANYIKAKTLWAILSEQGKKVGVINVPITYPPERVNGFIVPGIQYGIDIKDNFTYPSNLIDKIFAKFGTYDVAYGNLMGVYSHELDNYIKQWEILHNIREKVILSLMDEYEWDFFMAVFYSIDAIQHRFWKYYDENHPHYDALNAKKYANVIPTFYKKIDTSIGRILDKLDSSTVVMVVSDHGMGPEHKAFYLNTWLRKEGLLHIKRDLYPFIWLKPPHLFFKILNKLRYKGVAWTIPMALYNTLKRVVDPRDGLKTTYFIDWSKTKAYAANHTEQGIYINLKGREPNGTVQEGDEYEALRDYIISKLRGIIDPESGKPLFDEIHKKEDFYEGPHVRNAPDMFFLMRGATCLSHPELYHKGMFGVDNRNSATHRMDGIFIINGNGVVSGKTIQGANITDMAPTILHTMGLSVPRDMDGKVLAEVFNKPSSVIYGDDNTERKGTDSGVFSTEESENIKAKLRDLGYV
ncbi:MAG: alkaline phosphatase family protein [Candidatus Magnetoovum sp. WYHC-5]|nr:alkaline phosphatase family protein [Candidatus Magnetoovum sp. WYHC-5]